MFFRNELNLALKKISELETEINNLKKDTVSRKEFSVLQNKLSKAEETIKKLSENKTDEINKTKPDKTEVDVQPDKSKIAVSDKELSIKINETETKKTVSVKEFAAKFKNADSSIFKYADYKDGIEITKYIGLDRTSVEIPDYINGKPVIRIGNKAFCMIKEVLHVSFPRMLKEIGEEAFSGSGIQKLAPLNELEIIEKDAFSWCHQLKEVIIVSEKINIIQEGAFMECENLSLVRFPCKLRRIMPFAFSNCKSLKSIAFPESLNRIERCAFQNTSISKMVLPEKLEFLASTAVPISIKHIAFLSPDTEIDSMLLSPVVYCIPGGRVFDYIREQGTAVRPLEEFPE